MHSWLSMVFFLLLKFGTSQGGVFFMVHTCAYIAAFRFQNNSDHVIPKIKGGVDSWENLVSACVKCNLSKADNYIKDVNMPLLNKPKKPHFLIYMQGCVNNEYKSWKPYLYMN